MSTSKRSQFEAAMERISFGAVPIDGIFWLDPKLAARTQATGVTDPGSSSKRVEVRERVEVRAEADEVARTKRPPVLLSLTRLFRRLGARRPSGLAVRRP